MTHQGKRKFICLDCGDSTYFSTRERASRSRIKCRWCGSPAMEPSSGSKVNEEILQETANKTSSFLKESKSVQTGGKNVSKQE